MYFFMQKTLGSLLIFRTLQARQTNYLMEVNSVTNCTYLLLQGSYDVLDSPDIAWLGLPYSVIHVTGDQDPRSIPAI
jgi:hypothetical protein